MTPDEYESWYHTSRGAWIGNIEFRLLRQLLAAHRSESLIDIGCGSGYFTRRFAHEGLRATGIDPDAGMVDYSTRHRTGTDTYLMADASALPFADKSFDYAVAITSLCFIQEQRAALAEAMRVTRKRIVLGLLNRHSLLYWQKGRHGGSGAYRGAHWHTRTEVEGLLRELPVTRSQTRSAIYLPGGGYVARAAENVIPQRVLLGGFLAVAANLS